MSHFAGLDLEIATPIRQEADWRHQDLGITCLALYRRTDPRRPALVAAADVPHLMEHEERLRHPCAPRFSEENARRLLQELARLHDKEDIIFLTHNGASFDFRVLGQAAGDYATAARLALDSIDLMLLFAHLAGHRVSLKALAAGIGRTKGNHRVEDGAQAPQLWLDGEYAEVLAYCLSDAVLVYDVYQAVQRDQMFIWCSRSGQLRGQMLPDHLRAPARQTVMALARLWVDLPQQEYAVQRADFLGWMPSIILEEAGLALPGA